MNKTLYITDLDGTLLDGKGEVSEYSINAISRLMKNGLHLSYATARSYETAKRVTPRLNITEPVITYNGSFINQHLTGEILLSNYFDKSEIECVKKCLCRAEIYPFVCLMDGGREHNFYIIH